MFFAPLKLAIEENDILLMLEEKSEYKYVWTTDMITRDCYLSSSSFSRYSIKYLINQKQIIKDALNFTIHRLINTESNNLNSWSKLYFKLSIRHNKLADFYLPFMPSQSIGLGEFKCMLNFTLSICHNRLAGIYLGLSFRIVCQNRKFLALQDCGLLGSRRPPLGINGRNS